MKNINGKFKRAIYFICLVLLFFILWILPTRAAMIEKIEFDQSSKIIHIIGSCAGHAVEIRIFLAASAEPFYTAGSECRDGQYYFEDNLSYWEFDAGDYGIKIYDANDSFVNSSDEEYFRIEDVLNYAQFTTTTEMAEPSDSPPDDPPEIEVSHWPYGDNLEKDNGAPAGLLSRLFEAISRWFESALIIIKELAVKKIITSEFCLGETCVDENWLKDVMGEFKKADLSEDGHTPLSKEQDLPVAPAIIEFPAGILESSGVANADDEQKEDEIKNNLYEENAT